MDSSFLKGLIVVLLIHQCKAQDLPTSILPSVELTPQEASELTQEPELLAGEEEQEEVLPEVAPPSLKEVEDAVQEASELASEPGVEEVLKELLERVVEAAMREVQREAQGEVKEEVAEVEDGVEEELGGGGKQEVEEEGEVEEQGEQEEAVTEVVEEEVEVGGEGEAIEAGSVEESIAEEVEDQLVEAPVAPLTKGEVVEETALPEEEEEGGGKVVVEEMEGEDEEGGGKVVVEETEGEEEEGGGKVVVEETEGEEGGGKVVVEETEGEEEEGGGKVVVEETEGEEGEEVVQTEQETEEEAGAEVVIGEAGGEEEGDGESVGEEEGDEGVVVGAADQLGGEAGGREGGEETPETEDQEVLLDPGESSLRSIPGESQDPASPLGPHRPWGETESNTMGGEEILEDVDLESNDANKIITFQDNVLNLDPDEATSTLDNFVEDILTTAEEEEQGETNEVVEATTDTDNTESGLEAWKIGVISTAAFLVLETIVIIVYVLKCRDKTNRVCEEGCGEVEVEVEAGTAPRNEETPPVGDGDRQQIAALAPWYLDPSLTQQQEEGEEGVAMTDIQLNSIEDSTNRPVDPSHDVQTSVL
ncbi:cyclic nucleotide-gated cation channel beta-1 [Coregonus clupeaformis]|uniref:cyclic nucleotide-gated cation channel beta-1 n=1 Tax=Coregonus clupeaformis TaxID=59861 RepID=UPI001E1C4189|nr:cyclic nucleotide-gated cation channel beta-1 [Coregonus clupeaformis]